MPSFRSRIAVSYLLVGWSLLALFSAPSAWAQNARDKAVELSAVVEDSPPQITLRWLPSSFAITSQTVYRRVKSAASWGAALATPAVDATSFADASVQAGVSYEYFVYRVFNGGPGAATGYLSAGIRVPVVENRGRAILLVDETMAVPLAAELAQFESDLAGDGWFVVRENVSRTATPAQVRERVQSRYQEAPATTRALILFGRVPVPYSGHLAPDGHTEHIGAWPADVYYADINGVWNDTAVDDTAANRPENDNVPGDGKLDPSLVSGTRAVELETGRIDLANLPRSFASETELLRRYLTRDHAYRFNAGDYTDVPRRGLIADNFGYFGGEAFAATGWRAFTAFFGSGPQVAAGVWFQTLPTERYLWAYGCGGGSYQGAQGVGLSSDFAATPSRAVFDILFGSYFGDWDSPDNFLRAPLAGPDGSLGLVSFWAGRPPWFIHAMALGETIGYGAKVSQNNSGSLTTSYLADGQARGVHIALMGDPTLRLHTISPPASAASSSLPGAVEVSWSASPDAGVAGYMISRASAAEGPFSRIGSALTVGTSFIDNTVTPGVNYAYLVRAVKLETSGSGSYFNSSQGIFVTGSAAAVGSAPEINVAGNGVAIANGDAASGAEDGTDFGPVEMTAATMTHSFVIENAGSAALQFTGSPVVQISGAESADFSVVVPPAATLAAGASATVQILFHPSATGLRTALVSISSTDADESPFTFAISGTGTPALPQISIAPAALAQTLAPGAVGAAAFSITNSGEGALHFSIVSSLASYSFRTSEMFGGPRYQWIEIADPDVEIGGWADPDDAISTAIPLGFAFPFYGGTFTSVRVCTNGFLSFTDTGTSASNTPLPNGTAPANLLAAYWDDLILDAASHIYAGPVGEDFVVQYQDLAFFGDTTGRHISFEVVLKPSGAILLQYRAIAPTNDPYTIGIQNGSKSDAVFVTDSTSYVQNGLAIEITPPGLYSWLSASAMSGTVAPHTTMAFSAGIETSGLAAGRYFGELGISSDDPGAPLKMVAVQLAVGTPVELWRLEHFQIASDSGTAADAADPDGDGLTNRAEYGLTGDPLAPSAQPLPRVSTSVAGYLQMEFQRDASATDLTYFVEASVDLKTWPITLATSTAGSATVAQAAHSVGESGSGNVKTVTVEDAVPIEGHGARFLRVRIER